MPSEEEVKALAKEYRRIPVRIWEPGPVGYDTIGGGSEHKGIISEESAAALARRALEFAEERRDFHKRMNRLKPLPIDYSVHSAAWTEGRKPK
jgi:hypothetical protein